MGYARQRLTGGAPRRPLVLFKDQPLGEWTVLTPPDLGATSHVLTAVRFVPGTGGDFVVVGEFYRDPSIAYSDGLLLHCQRDPQSWELTTFADPGAVGHFVHDLVFDPDDRDRLLIVGARHVTDPCPEFRTLAVDYRLDTHAHTVLPTISPGDLKAIALLPGAGSFDAKSLVLTNLPLLIDGFESGDTSAWSLVGGGIR